MDNRRNDGWDMIIRPRKGWFDIDIKGLVHYRDLILLRYDLGYSTKEIAELTDTTRAAVQKTLFRARRALEKEMEAL